MPRWLMAGWLLMTGGCLAFSGVLMPVAYFGQSVMLPDGAQVSSPSVAVVQHQLVRFPEPD